MNAKQLTAKEVARLWALSVRAKDAQVLVNTTLKEMLAARGLSPETHIVNLDTAEIEERNGQKPQEKGKDDGK